MRSGVVDPAQSSAARALKAMNLGVDTDFDDGVRALKRGFSETTEADAITEHIQSLALADHNDSQRKRMNNLPTEIADSLGSSWHISPHNFKSNLRHMRGSFPMATKAAGVVVSLRDTKNTHTTFVAKMMKHREELHEPAIHDDAPAQTAAESTYDDAPAQTSAESTTYHLPCHLAGFCVHGSDGAFAKAIHDRFLTTLMQTRFPKANTIGRRLLCDSVVSVCVLAQKGAGRIIHL